jgi:hypothetical protein
VPILRGAVRLLDVVGTRVLAVPDRTSGHRHPTSARRCRWRRGVSGSGQRLKTSAPRFIPCARWVDSSWVARKRGAKRQRERFVTRECTSGGECGAELLVVEGFA